MSVVPNVAVPPPPYISLCFISSYSSSDKSHYDSLLGVANSLFDFFLVLQSKEDEDSFYVVVVIGPACCPPAMVESCCPCPGSTSALGIETYCHIAAKDDVILNTQ